MLFYVGVVEDRFDPLELGRCRVRVFGVHNDDRNEQPVADLPWSIAMGPIQSASNSGVGLSPTGIVHGSWVIGFFLDGEDKQQFIMMGTLTAIQAQAMISSGAVAGTSTTTTSTSTTASSSSSTSTSSTATASAPVAAGAVAATTPVNQTPVTNTVSGSVDPTTVRQPSGWTLGQTSKQYESGSRGCAAINSYANSGDLGGASYGSYQFASYLPQTMPNGKARPSAAKSPVLKYLAASAYGTRFAGLNPATSAFDNMWKACASSDPTGFQNDQHQFVKATYYDVMIGNLKRNGLDLTSFGAGVQDLVWSTAVQMGPARTSVFLTPLKGMTQLDDVTIINTVMNYKIANVPNLFSRSSANIQAGVSNRYNSEKKALLALAGQYNSAAQIPSTPAEKVTVMPSKAPTPIPAATTTAAAPVYSSNSPVATQFVASTDTSNTSLVASNKTGFNDPDGVYPLSAYANQPDTNMLARGVYAGTPAQDKSTNRSTGMPLSSDGDTFDQPLNPYNAKYPYNKVMQTEAGHVVEYDDTPGSERINIYHTSGTFTEIDAEGNMVRRVTGSDYQITDGNGYVRVEGRCNISVGGSANVYVSADANIEVDGDVSVSAGNDIDVYAAGRVTVSGGEALDFRGTDVYISADNDFHVTAGGVFNVEAGGAMNLKADTAMYLQAANNVEVTGGSGINATTSSGDINLNANGNANIQSGGDSNIDAGGSAKVFGSSSAHLKSSGMTALDGSSMNIQNGSSVQAGGAGKAAAASDAEYGEAGLDDARTEYTENVIDDVFPTNRVDSVARMIETPEEVANGGTAAVQAAMVSQGIVASTTELKAATPVVQLTTAQAVSTLPGAASSVTSAISSAVSSATSAVSSAVSSAESAVSSAITSAESAVSSAITSVENAASSALTAIESAVSAVIKPFTPNAIDTKVQSYLKNMSGIPGSFKMTPNFSLADLSSNAPAQHDKVVAQCNLTEGQIVGNLYALAVNVLEPIKAKYPNMFVTSGFRKYDSSLTSTTSQHNLGMAADIQFKGASPSDYCDIATAIQSLLSHYDQLLLEYVTTGSGNPWIHVSFNSAGNRGQAMTMYNNTIYGSGLTKLQ